MRVLILLLMIASALPVAAGEFFPTRNVLLNNRLYQLEIARTPAQRRQGLMYRSAIPRNGGMLFLYQRPGHYRIWMKNTLIPLTVIWLDSQAKILDIKLLQPCRQIRCPAYTADQPSQFIVELHQDQREQFKPGQRLPALLEFVSE